MMGIGQREDDFIAKVELKGDATKSSYLTIKYLSDNDSAVYFSGSGDSVGHGGQPPPNIFLGRSQSGGTREGQTLVAPLVGAAEERTLGGGALGRRGL